MDEGTHRRPPGRPKTVKSTARVAPPPPPPVAMSGGEEDINYGEGSWRKWRPTPPTPALNPNNPVPPPQTSHRASDAGARAIPPAAPPTLRTLRVRSGRTSGAGGTSPRRSRVLSSLKKHDIPRIMEEVVSKMLTEMPDRPRR
eukprot:gene7939-12630_t